MNSPVDFTLLCDVTEGYAVHCETEDDANLFIAWARRLYPRMCTMWSYGVNNYGQNGKDTVYTFDSKINGRWEKKRLMFGSVRVTTSLGYKIIEFDDICKHTEINESDQPINYLLT